MNKGFFVTGTDTGVGKTVVAGALVLALKAMGLNACGMKPVESGCVRGPGGLVPADSVFLRELSGEEGPLEEFTPYRFASPLAPMPAAELEGIEIDPIVIMNAYGNIASRHDAVVMEGIGGLLVPLTPVWSVADLALETGLPLVVVASPFLGTLNHTLLTVRYAQGMGIKVAGVVINYHRPAEETLAERTNPAVLEMLCPAPLLGVMTHVPGLGRETLLESADALDLDLLSRFLY